MFNKTGVFFLWSKKLDQLNLSLHEKNQIPKIEVMRKNSNVKNEIQIFESWYFIGPYVFASGLSIYGSWGFSEIKPQKSNE